LPESGGLVGLELMLAGLGSLVALALAVVPCGLG
jgi:hypothetical protein